MLQEELQPTPIERLETPPEPVHDRVGELDPSINEQPTSELEGAAEQDVTAERPGFVVERRTVGETNYTFVLIEHTKQAAEAMKRALWHCNYIGIEQPGHNNGKPRRDQSTEFRADQEIIDSTQELAEKPQTKVFFIDMHEDDPKIGLVESSKKALLAYTDSLVSLEPTAESRALLLTAGKALADSSTAREATVRQQLEVVPANVGKAEVGIVLGALHYRAIEGLGTTPDQDTSVHQRVSQSFESFDRIVEAYRDDQEPDEADVNYQLLANYFLVCGIDRENLNKVSDQLQPDLVGRLLVRIEAELTLPTRFDEKYAALTRFLSACYEIMEDHDDQRLQMEEHDSQRLRAA